MGTPEPEYVERTYQFARKVVAFYRGLRGGRLEQTLGIQLVRSATSVAANLQEAQGALPKREFTHKVNLAKKEAREAAMWLRLFRDESLGDSRLLAGLLDEGTQIRAILHAIEKSAARGLQKTRDGGE